MKKVLFVATVDSHILAFHLPYLEYFKNKGYEVHIATNGNEAIPFCDKKIFIPFEREPFKINNLRAIKQLKKVIEEEQYSLIHCHTPMGATVTRLAAKRARKKYGTKVIYTAHGFHFYKGSPFKFWAIFYPVEKYLSRYTDTIITINEEDYNLAKRKFIRTNVEYVHGIGLSKDKFDFKMTEKEKLNLRKSLGLTKDDFIIIYPAELSDRKNQLWLINTIKENMNKHSNIHLLLPGRDSLDGKCQNLVRELNLEDNIHFLGFRTDIPKLLKISDMSVSSSKQEGLAVNVMEAIFERLPIVATDCRGNTDLIEEGKNGYIIKQGDSHEFCKKIEKIYSGKVNLNNGLAEKYMLDSVMEEMGRIYMNNM